LTKFVGRLIVPVFSFIQYMKIVYCPVYWLYISVEMPMSKMAWKMPNYMPVYALIPTLLVYSTLNYYG